MESNEQLPNWNLTVRTALIMTAVGLALFGVGSMDRVDCRVCWKDITHHYFAVFGYLTGFGYAIGWTLPTGSAQAENGKHSWNTRQGFWEGSFGLGALLTLVFAAMQLLS